MKLTEFDINCIGNPNTSYTDGALKELKQAIRKAKEDAEKYRILKEDMGYTNEEQVDRDIKNHFIVKRLKKRIEELEKIGSAHSEWNLDELIEELQEILGEKE